MMSDKEYWEQVEKIFAFHKRRAPGIVISLAMYQLAMEKLGPVEKFTAYAESIKCLPDVLQFMLGATIGNGDLRLNLTGRFAMAIFNSKTKKGVRVFVDINKIDPEKTPTLYKFFLRQRGDNVLTDKAYRKESNAKVIEEFMSVREQGIFGVQEVTPIDMSKPPVASATICDKCHEAFTTFTPENKICPHCNGDNAYYNVI